MKKYIWMSFWLIWGLIVFGMPLSAEIKVGYIDSNRILEGYLGKDQLKEQLEKEIAEWQEDAIKKKQEVENLVKEFESQSLMLSEESRARKHKEIGQKQQEYEEFVQRIWGPEGEAKQKNDEIMKPFIEKVNLILQELGEKENYTIIFDVASTGVVYAKEGMDLTELVLEELNQEFAPVTEEEEKIYFWVFKFDERTPEAREWGHGTQFSKLLMVGLVKSEKFKEVKSGKFQDAWEKASINKKEYELTDEEAAYVGKLAEAELIVTGKVTRVGEKIDITCKIIATNTASVMAEESGTSQTGEREDIERMVNEMAANLIQKLE